MLVGGEKIHDLAVKILHSLENVNPDELVEVDEVMIVVATHYGSDLETGTEAGNLFYRCTSARIHVQYGLLEHARRAVDHNIRPIGE